VLDSGRGMLPDRQCALTATTHMHLTRVRLTATMGLAGLSVEFSSAPGRGIRDTGAGAAGVRVIMAAAAMVRAITAAQAMVRAITAAQAGATVAAPQPTLDAVLHTVQGAATVATLAVDFTVEQVVPRRGWTWRRASLMAWQVKQARKAHGSGRGLEKSKLHHLKSLAEAQPIN